MIVKCLLFQLQGRCHITFTINYRNIHVEVFVFVCDLEGAIEFGFDWWSLRIFMLMLLCYFICRNNLSISTDLFFPVTTSFDL